MVAAFFSNRCRDCSNSSRQAALPCVAPVTAANATCNARKVWFALSRIALSALSPSPAIIASALNISAATVSMLSSIASKRPFARPALYEAFSNSSLGFLNDCSGVFFGTRYLDLKVNGHEVSHKPPACCRWIRINSSGYWRKSTCSKASTPLTIRPKGPTSPYDQSSVI